MLFNSFQYLLFLPIVFCLYWFLAMGQRKMQNVLLLAASYFFYACWDYRFLALLVFSTLLDYITGIIIADNSNVKTKKLWLYISVITNLGFLGFFKYYNFFIDSFANALTSVGLHANPWTLNIILPVGISFYTFHGLSYVYDIYNNKIQAERNFVDYSLFVSFFPLLVAGPIERATHLLPQIKRSRSFDAARAAEGTRQMIWGFFKKIVIADSLAPAVNDIFLNYESYSGGTLILGIIFFAVQIYGDFSGYSDIALGTAKLLGFDLIENFKFPYFAKNIGDFWRRWHISLSSWFRDYVYIPLGGSRRGQWISIRNVLIIFLISGFWHGANWTFIIWGLIHAILFLPSLFRKESTGVETGSSRNHVFKYLYDGASVLITFSLVSFAWIFFRAESVSHAFDFISEIDLSLPSSHRSYVVFVILLFVLDFLYFKLPLRRVVDNLAFNWVMLTLVLFYFLTATTDNGFIYFQF